MSAGRDLTDRLIDIAHDLREATARLQFSLPVSRVYRPLIYAWDPHRRYLECFGGRGASVLLIGMNPGPFGMVQTGIPFGDVHFVRDWLGIEGEVGRPRHEHAKRPVQGFACPRREVSGQRFWGWARDSYGEPARFFDRFFVWNYCPLAFMEQSGQELHESGCFAQNVSPLLGRYGRFPGRSGMFVALLQVDGQAVLDVLREALTIG